MTIQHRFGAALVALASMASWAGAQTIRPLVTSRTEGISIGQQFGLTRQGNPLYTGSGNSGENPLFEGSGALRITIVGNSFGSPAVLANGTVVYQTNSPDGQNGLFARTLGGVIITIRGDNFGPKFSYRAAASGNQVAIITQDTPSSESVSAGPLAGISAAQIAQSRLGRPAVNTLGTVAVVGTDSTGASALFVRSGGSIITINGSNFGLASIWGDPHVDEKDGTRFFATDTSGATGLYEYTPAAGTVAKVSDFGLSRAAAFSDNGSVASLSDASGTLHIEAIGMSPPATVATLASGASFANANLAPATLISVGDSLDGSTITDLGLSPTSFAVANEVAFWASLADGTTGLYVYPVPEPAALSALTLGLLTCMRRPTR
ncbi:MAG: hypothetical protein QM770_23320 [Tepidisphaeraceae bacterium]